MKTPYLQSSTAHLKKIPLHYSEDYYGDLDLKSIRKSELLAGLQGEGRKKGTNKGAAASS